MRRLILARKFSVSSSTFEPRHLGSCFPIILRGVFLEGTPFHLLLDQFWPMAIIGLVNLCLAGYLFRHRLY